MRQRNYRARCILLCLDFIVSSVEGAVFVAKLCEIVQLASPAAALLSPTDLICFLLNSLLISHVMLLVVQDGQLVRLQPFR
jgi:hypothetical protein